MIHPPTDGGVAEDREPAAMKQLGKVVCQPRLLAQDARRRGHRVHLAGVTRVHELAEAARGLLDLAEEPARLRERAAHAHAVEHAVHEVLHLGLEQGAVLRAHLLGRALEEQHLRPIVNLQPARAVGGDHAPLAGDGAERGNLVVQHGGRDLQEAHEVGEGDGFNLVTRVRVQLPLLGGPGGFLLQVPQVHRDESLLAVRPAEARGQAVCGPHPEVQRAGGNLERLDGLRLRRGAQHSASDAFELFVCPLLDLAEQRQQRELLARQRELPLAELRVVQLVRRTGEPRDAGFPDDAKLLPRSVNPQRLTIAPG